MADDFSQLEALGVRMPYSIEAEQAVLGAIIIDSDVYHDVVDVLEPQHFYSNQNSEIFRCIQFMTEQGETVDFVSLLDKVDQAAIFDTKAAAKQYLFEISQTVPAVSNAGSYARIVYDKYLTRSLLSASSSIITQVNTSDSTAEELLSFAEQTIDDIRRGRDTSSLRRFNDAVEEMMAYLSNISGEEREKYLGIRTGFSHLDRVINGLKRSNLIILAARPGFGKTSLALNIASNVISNYPSCAVAVFSLEMSRRQLAERIASGVTGIPANVFQTGTKDNTVWDELFAFHKATENNLLFLDDTSSVTVSQIKAKARRVKDLGLIIVDYLQLMTSGKRVESRVQEISDITRQFKILAKELDVPVLLLSQLSRSNEKEHRPPVLSDLRDSGSIEQDADIVMFIHRDKDEDDRLKNETNLLLRKNRHGPLAKILLNFDGEHTRFSSVAMIEEDE